MKPYQLMMVMVVAINIATGLQRDYDAVNAGNGTFWNYAGVVSFMIFSIFVLFGKFTGESK